MEIREKIGNRHAVQVNTNNPTSNQRYGDQDADVGRAPARTITPFTEINVEISSDGTPRIKVGVNQGPIHQRDWQTITNLPAQRDYLNMDTGIQSEGEGWN